MSGQPITTATRTGSDVALTLWVEEGPVRVELSCRRAAVLGLDLLSLALEPLFRLEVKEDPPGDVAGRSTPPVL